MQDGRAVLGRAIAHAKLNYYLEVVGRRPDGYHELVSVMQSVAFGDELVAEAMDGAKLAAGSGAPAAFQSGAPVLLIIEGETGAQVPAGPDNLVLRAARALWERASRRPLPGQVDAGPAAPVHAAVPVRLRLIKRIPVGAGLAGGSADAAAALRLLARVWGLHLPEAELAKVALSLGADVPFCLTGGTALARGVGERLEKLPAPVPQDGWIVVAWPPASLLTAEVFRAYDALLRRPVAPGFEAVAEALRRGDWECLGRGLFNGLEAASLPLCPQARRLKEALVREGALGAVQSGSGPSVLALALGRERAERLLEAARRDGAQAILTRPVGTGVELC